MSSLPPPDILLEQGACLLINKPGGLLTQGPPGIDSLELRVKRFLIERDNKPGKAYLGVPHRLDRPVSGVIVVAKNVRAAQRISTQIRERRVEKIYWALVEGPLPSQGNERGTWRDWMRKIPGQAKSELVPADHPDAREAILNFRLIRSVQRDQQTLSLLEIELQTGRTHQIRLQAASRGFPILGDQLYGSRMDFGPSTNDLRQRWIGLHARRLGLEHPMDRTPIIQTCPLPACWNEYSELLIPDVH